MKFLCCTLSAAAALGAAAAAQRVDRTRAGLPQKSARIVSYRMRVRLDPSRKTVRGEERIRYRNATTGTTQELRFHLYLNAFHDLDSTHLRESERAARTRYKSPDEFGGLEIEELKLVRGAGGPADLASALAFVAPDDGNPKDRTVARVLLPKPFAPGSEVELFVRFTAKLPKAYRRTGWGPGNFFMVAQWFPKLGVLEDRGGGRAEWNCHQFHAWTEFYADYGTYDVVLELPKDWPVGATGRLVESKPLEPGWVAHRFVQEDVHDFAWVTDPDYRVYEFTFDGARGLDRAFADLYRRRLGYGEKELALRDVDVRILLHPEHATPAQVERHKRAVFAALSFFGSRFGRYPYPTLTVVDPCADAPPGRSLGGGMEYPTLITCGTPYFLHPRRLAPEGVTVHEFGHQFWYGLSGNNEFEASYLDEGWNSYSEGRCLDVAYAELAPDGLCGDPLQTARFGPFTVAGRNLHAVAGLGRGLPARLTRLEALPLTSWLPTRLARPLKALGFRGTILPGRRANPFLAYLEELPCLSYLHGLRYRSLYGDRAGFLRDPDKDPMVREAWRYLDRSSYRVNSYPKPATLLATLERMAGPERWWPFMRRWHEQARFAHPTIEDFLALLEKTCGREIAAFAREAATTTKALDYGVERVRELPPLGGRPAGTEVVVRRFGQLKVPITVRFVFAGRRGGSRLHRDVLWPVAVQGSWRRYVIEPSETAAKGPLIEVLVDPPRKDLEPRIGPAGVYLLDRNLLNNAWSKKADGGASGRVGLRALLFVQSVLGFFGGLG